jgi:mycothiol synthase
MVTVEVFSPPAPGHREIAQRLDDAARARDGHESLSAAIRRDLETPSDASTALVAYDDALPVGYGHLAASDTFAAPHLVAGLVLDPDHRADGEVAGALLREITPTVAARGGGRVVLWITGADDALDAVARGAGFAPVSELFQMRVALPLGESPRWPAGVTVRSFAPGKDDAEWLRVNNRAFRNHPDQGGWVESTLRRRMAEPWFDPAGFVLAFDDDGLAGFCWTKVHEESGGDPRMGEIFVVGVDPDRHGTGLGRALTVAGLEHLARDRGCPTGLLYVDAANTAALGLYRALGFRVHRTDRAYELTVPRP